MVRLQTEWCIRELYVIKICKCRRYYISGEHWQIVIRQYERSTCYCAYFVQVILNNILRLVPEYRRDRWKCTQTIRSHWIVPRLIDRTASGVKKSNRRSRVYTLYDGLLFQRRSCRYPITTICGSQILNCRHAGRTLVKTPLIYRCGTI